PGVLPVPPHRHPTARVLLLDNYDSFTYNLAQYLVALGARVKVVRNDARSLSALRALRPTHVVLSPGPGRPAEAGVTCAAVRAFEGTPLLGVCLGHEAIVEVYGGSLGIAARRMHGKTSRIRRTSAGRDRGPLCGLPETFEAARYHSLVARRVPSVLEVTARSDGDEVMAVQHSSWPTYGVQFHPESLRTPPGMAILDNFLFERPIDG
ncbi:anthranilate synthase component II, partial [mine drainage metagenome]